ncbi:M20 family metallopeptidase [Tundrisphaera lichenicola]|uniref:M20 family metallopeptidase n=1 Tax=Tundrisphaera lichenicola TaxID=2029860 RepID=UPI003EBF337E
MGIETTGTRESLPESARRIATHVDRRRLLSIAERLISAPSPTGRAAPAADALASILIEEGFAVDRLEAGHHESPAVVARLASSKPGRTLQFNGHLDTVHLPFKGPRVEGDLLTGSGASDMKGGVAAAVEALLALRDSGLLAAGSVLLTAHDLHEAPWGFGQQIDRMIADGCVGDAVLLPEPLSDRLPVAGRGQACWSAVIRRPGAPVHEVMRPLDEPSVIAAGAELVSRLTQLNDQLSVEVDPIAGRSSAFIGQFHAGEIFNGFPQTCHLEGTRRWIPGTDRANVESEFRSLMAGLADSTRTTIDLNYQLVRDAFFLDQADPLVGSFGLAFETISGRPLPIGPKPFVDDGNSFWALARVPAITHGPRAGGQHTVEEWSSIEDLIRVANLYALTATLYCPGG